MNTMTFFANTEIPSRVALTAGHRGYAGMDASNIRLAQKLCRASAETSQIADTAAIGLRGEAGIGLYNV